MATASGSFGRERGRLQASVNAFKTFSRGVTLSIDVTNLFNHRQLTGYHGVLLSPFFGQPSQALNPRRIELSLAYRF